MPEKTYKRPARSLEGNIKKAFKVEKNAMYAKMGGGSQPEGMNDVWLHLAKTFKMPVRQVKDIVYPGGWVD